MMSTWDRVHARYRLMDKVMRRVRVTGDPGVVERWRQDIEETFGDFGAFLLHLQRQWYTRLATGLDLALETATTKADHSELVRRVWAQLADADPAMRAVLDAYAEHAELAANDQRLRRRLGSSVPSADQDVPAYAS